MQNQRTGALRGALVVKERDGGRPVVFAKWRDGDGRQVMRRLGDGWLVSEEDRDAKPGGYRIGSWVQPKGRTVPDGFLTRRDAEAQMAALITAHENGVALEPDAAKAERLRERARLLEAEARRIEGEHGPTFADAAEAWWRHRRDVKRIKPSTLRDYRLMLDARVLSRWGDWPLASIEAKHLIAWRDELADAENEEGAPLLSPRTVNKHMIVVGSILRFACRPTSVGGFGLERNPAEHVERLSEPPPEELDYYEPHEVLAIARALREGRHRSNRTPAGGEFCRPQEIKARAVEDLRDAAAIVTAGFAGLRRGELAGLQHRDLDFANERIMVRRGYVLGQLTTTKGKAERVVPMARQVLTMFDGLEKARREYAEAAGLPAPVGSDDFVFGSLDGSPLDASALRRRYSKARDEVGLRPLRLHSLRHSFVTIAREGFGIDKVRAFAGHADARTAQRYAHAKSRSSDAEELSRRFECEDFGPELARAAA